MPAPDPVPYPQLFDPGFAEQAQRRTRAWQRIERRVRRRRTGSPAAEFSMLTDIGHGLARGVAVTAPEMFGKALQAFGADETGKSIADAAAERGKDELYRTTGLAGNVAEMLPVGLGLMGLGAAGAVSSPFAAMAAPAVAGAALFGGSQYTTTREKGGTVGEALATGAIQGVGQAVGGAVAGRLATGAANALQKGALSRGFEAFTDPSLWGTMGRSLIHAEATQLPVQAAAMAGTAAVEQGLPDTPTAWQAAKDSFAPTALLTAAMTPFGAPAIMKTNATRAATAAKIRNDQLPVTDRMRAVHEMARDLRKVDETGTNDWELNALDALSAGVTPELNPDYKYVRGQPVPPEPPPPPALLPTPVRGMSDRTGDIPNEEQRAASADFERQNAELWQRRAETERRQGPFALEPSGGEGDLRLQPEVAGVRGAVFEGGTYGQERPLESPERVPEGQGELDLAPVMNRRPGERPSPLEDAAMAREAADKAAREAPSTSTGRTAANGHGGSVAAGWCYSGNNAAHAGGSAGRGGSARSSRGGCQEGRSAPRGRTESGTGEGGRSGDGSAGRCCQQAGG